MNKQAKARAYNDPLMEQQEDKQGKDKCRIHIIIVIFMLLVLKNISTKIQHAVTLLQFKVF